MTQAAGDIRKEVVDRSAQRQSEMIEQRKVTGEKEKLSPEAALEPAVKEKPMADAATAQTPMM